MPELKKLTIVTEVFYIGGLLITGIYDCLSNPEADGAKALMTIGGLVALAGIVLYIILISKTRSRLKD